MQMEKKKKAGVAVLIFNKIDFKTKAMYSKRERKEKKKTEENTATIKWY